MLAVAASGCGERNPALAPTAATRVTPPAAVAVAPVRATGTLEVTVSGGEGELAAVYSASNYPFKVAHQPVVDGKARFELQPGAYTVAVTGPNRGLARPLGWYEAVPHGDMMLAGPFGLVAATRAKAAG